MIFTMVAVAVAGYLLVESSPDFSNYALLTRSYELDDHLSRMRRAVQSRPYTLYTTLGELTEATASSPSSEALMKRRLESLLIRGALLGYEESSGQAPAAVAGRPPRGPEGSAQPSFLSTVARDPYVPANQWFTSDASGGSFWSRNYNLVRNPTFGNAPFREVYVEDSFEVFFAAVLSDGRSEIWKVRPLGVPVPFQPLISIPGENARAPQISPDGSRVLYVRERGGSDSSEVWTANALDGQAQTRISTPGLVNAAEPLWSPLGGRVLYRNTATNRLEVKGLLQGSTAAEFPHDLQQAANASWSPDGRYVAYIGTVGGAAFLGVTEYGLAGAQFVAGTVAPQSYLERLVFYASDSDAKRKADHINQGDTSRLIDPNGQGRSLGGLPAKIPASPLTPAWAPSSQGRKLVYLSRSDSRLHLLDLVANSDTVLPHGGGVNGAGIERLWWVPESVQPSTLTSANWLLVSRSSPRGIFRRRVNDGKGYEYPVASPDVGLDSGAFTQPTSVAVSGAGTRIAFVTGTSTLMLAHSDGADRGLGSFVPIAQAPGGGVPALSAPARLPAASNVSRIESPAIGPVKSSWVYPPANVTTIDSSQHSRFEPASWREFLHANEDFEGDLRFGTQWLRVEPAARTDAILFDNGESSFLLSRSAPGETLTAQGSNIDPVWSPRGQTWVGREAESAIGDDPVNIFRVPFKDTAATTVRLTTGIEPALSPDDSLLAVSQARGRVTTFPPSRTAFPIDDMDIVVVNAAGAVEPPLKVLTAGTPESQEREPAWSPDGRTLYFQREVQEAASLATHGSSIYRITRDGGVMAEVQGTIPGHVKTYTSRVEFYYPAVSPCGTRLAFIGKERLRTDAGSVGASGQIISDTLYVKDLLTNAAPVAILRFVDPDYPPLKDGEIAAEFGKLSDEMWSLSHPSWSSTGEEIILLRFQDRNRRGNERYPSEDIYTWDPDGDGIPYNQDEDDGEQEILRVRAADPRHLTGTARRALHENFDVIVTTKTTGDGARLSVSGTGTTRRQIFNPSVARGAMVMQRVAYSEPQSASVGVALGDRWYVLSGFARTSAGAQDVRAAQITVQILDDSGLLVDQARSNQPVFQSGVLDVGDVRWMRFSQAINFGSPPKTGTHTFCLLLYSTGSVGSFADFTGIALEPAYDANKPYPTRLGIGWNLISSSSQPDPRRPESLLFER